MHFACCLGECILLLRMKKKNFLLDHDIAETLLFVMWLVWMALFPKIPEQMPLGWMAVCAVLVIYLAIPVAIDFFAQLRRGFSWWAILTIWMLLAAVSFVAVFFVRVFGCIASCG